MHSTLPGWPEHQGVVLEGCAQRIPQCALAWGTSEYSTSQLQDAHRWDVTSARFKKADERGAFWRRYILQEVIEDESITKSEWCSHTPSNTLYLEDE